MLFTRKSLIVAKYALMHMKLSNCCKRMKGKSIKANNPNLPEETHTLQMLDKIRLLSLTDKEVLGEGDNGKLDIQIKLDKEKRILSNRDRGIGMTIEDLIENLGTIAKSGTSAFVEKMQTNGDLNLIGQFGVGFYSVYLVADHAEVISKHNDDKQYVWESKADGAFAISLGRGTEIRLHLRGEAGEYLEESKLKAWVLADQRKAGYLGRFKLVTVRESKRELTPEIVKAALYGSASAKTCAPQINLAATPAPKAAAPTSQLSGTTSAASPNNGTRLPQLAGNEVTNQHYFQSQQRRFMRQQNLVSQGMLGGGTVAAPRPLTPDISTDWLGGSASGLTSQAPSRGITPTSQDEFASDSLSGDVLSATPAQPEQRSSSAAPSTSHPAASYGGGTWGHS